MFGTIIGVVLIVTGVWVVATQIVVPLIRSKKLFPAFNVTTVSTEPATEHIADDIHVADEVNRLAQERKKQSKSASKKKPVAKVTATRQQVKNQPKPTQKTKSKATPKATPKATKKSPPAATV